MVYDADRPFVRGFSRGLHELVLTIPKEIYAELIGPAGPDLPAVFDFGAGAGSNEQALARLLQATLSMIAAPGLQPPRRADARPGPYLARAEADTLGLVRLILGSPDSSATGLVASAKDFIERHLADRELSPAQVATWRRRHLMLSPATGTWRASARRRARGR